MRLESLLKNKDIVSLYKYALRALGGTPMWLRNQGMEFQFFGRIADLYDLPEEEAVNEIRKAWRFLDDEVSPGENASFYQAAGLVVAPPGQVPGEASFILQPGALEVTIRHLCKGWSAEKGVHVGPGNAEFGSSVFEKQYVEKMPKDWVTRALAGRDLYVLNGHDEWATELIHRFGLSGLRSMSYQEWERALRRMTNHPLTVALTGVVLKVALLHRPGTLGSFFRAFPCCALEGFRRQQDELLPLPLPEETPADQELREVVEDLFGRMEPMTSSDVENLEKMIRAHGHRAWTWMGVMMVNYMYCTGQNGKMLTDTMMHCQVPSKVQVEAVQRLEDASKLWVKDFEDKVTFANWEHLSENLGDMYTGQGVCKSYSLTLEAIIPTTPGKGEAARVDLSSVVSEHLKAYVDDPSRVRIPDEELVNPRISAKVQVDSQEEWNKIVSHLCQAGMLEREVAGETLTYRGTPVRNGAFGVHKKWIAREDGSWLRCLRLIINLIPSNGFQRRLPIQASKAMGYAPLWGQLSLHDGEVLLCCAEDQRHCFHVYRPGYSWRGFFVLNRKASGASFGDGRGEPAYPRVISAPMGWNNVVDFIQDGFENLGKRAGLTPSHIIKMNEPSPLAPLVTPRTFHSFYVDNYDELHVVWETDVGIYEGKPSDSQVRLRREMERIGVERDPQKAAENSKSWTSLGAEVDGIAGRVGSSLKFRRALLGANLQSSSEAGLRRHSLDFQSVVSKNMHSVQYNRSFACLFDEIYLSMGQSQNGEVSQGARDELLLLSCSLPFHWISQRSGVCGQVFATDASPDGGGACISTGLTRSGFGRVHSLVHEAEGMENGASDPLVVVEMFAGMGGLHQALELLGLTPMGVIGVDISPESARVMRHHCRHIMWYKNIEDITKEEVKRWRAMHPKALRVLISGGWPCVNHSVLNPWRQGANASTSMLLDSMLQIRDWLKIVSAELGLPSWEVCELYENVVMDKSDLESQSAKIGCKPTFVEAADVGWVRRPRLYWQLNLPLIKAVDAKVVGQQQMRGQDYALPVVQLQTEKLPLETFLKAGCRKMAEPSQPFATLTRPKARQHPPEQPAGLEQCTAKAIRRWKGDAHRVQPYQYEDRNLVLDPSSGPRRPTAEEQLRLMGFTSSHLTIKKKLTNDEKQQLIGNSFHAIVVARLLCRLVCTQDEVQGQNLTAILWETWTQLEEKAALEEKPWQQRFGLKAAGVSGVVGLRKLLLPQADLPLRAFVDPGNRLTDEEFLAYLLTRVATHRNGELRVDLGQPYSSGTICRQSVDPGSWTWKVLLSYKWKEKSCHINVLESIAILDLTRKLAKDQRYHGKRLILLVDNQVALNVLCKGRSGAKALQMPLRRIMAVLVSMGSSFCLGWVKSKWNPADGPSRWAHKQP